ncbi:type II secretion system F family protein [Porticoccaceae bacterium]|jgi:type II secretory pathway component PulF|nr:type II secretion system F family protein [Porticoccaceae bacterium]MDB2383123.1 type II secretion system F family protein [Porticoccaceae bacterium]MDB2669523.1 type II secretion system F family protein [Porticoccaceae bacterium]
MPRFIYHAYDAGGGKLQGEIEAQDVNTAKHQIAEQQLMLVEIKEDGAMTNGVDIFKRNKVTNQEIEYLTAELSLLLNSGVTIDRALGIIKRNSTSAPQAKLVGQLHDAVRRGESLSDALGEHQAVFNPLYLNLISLGEASGTLPTIFSRLVEDMKFQSELKRKVIQALIYPSVIFSVCMLCILFVFNYIVPQMQSLFDGLPELPFYTAMLLGVSNWVVSYQWILLAIVLASGVGIYVARKNPSSAATIDTFVAQMPGFSGMVTRVERIRFNTAITLMLESGILIDRCLEMAVGSIKNRELKQGLASAKDRVKKGATLSTALRSSPVFDDFSMSLIEVGEESGELAPVFSEISSRARREFESSVDRMTSLLEPALILFMGGIVGGVVVTMLLSIVSVNDVGF